MSTGADQLAALHAQWAEAQDKLAERKALAGVKQVNAPHREDSLPFTEQLR